MSYTDGKRPDGNTIVPWRAEKKEVWDVTVTDTIAVTYLPSNSVTAGSAAEIAGLRKEGK